MHPNRNPETIVLTQQDFLHPFWKEKENYLYAVMRMRLIWQLCIVQPVELIYVNNALKRRIQQEHLPNIEGITT